MKISLSDDKSSKPPKQSEFKNIASLKFSEVFQFDKSVKEFSLL